MASDSIAIYEQEFAKLVRAKYSIAFSYARIALRSIMSVIKLGPGAEVILSPLTCKVVPLTLLSLGLKPIYADIAEETLNLDHQCIESVIGSNSQVLLFQYTYGNTAGIEDAARVAALNELVIIEDCAQCFPYATDESFPGSWGQAAIFSNNLLKPLPAGSGGIAITNNQFLAAKIREARDRQPQGSKIAEIMLYIEIWIHKYLARPALYWPLFDFNRKISSNYKVRSVNLEIADEILKKTHTLSHFQISEGIHWLLSAGACAKHRQTCCEEYYRHLSDIQGLKIPSSVKTQPLYYFPVLVNNKEELLKEASRKRIEIIAWPIKTPIYPIEMEKDLLPYGYKHDSCPIAEKVASKLVGLPTHGKIKAKERNKIINLLINSYS